jgi:lysophospholipase L1-like esterase
VQSIYKLIFIIGLALALAVSILFNYLTFSYARQYYLQLNAARLDPLGLSYYSDQRVSPDPERNRVVFFGDSRAADWPEPASLDNFEFINRGIGAQTSAQAVERFEAHVTPLRPQVIVVQVCINDLKTIPLFPELQETIVANCRRNIERMVAEARALKARVILTTIFPPGELSFERRLFWSDEVTEAIEDVNRFMATLQAEDVIIFDAAAVLADDQGKVQKIYSRDSLHLTEAGYAVLNKELTPLLLQLVP